MVDQSGRKYSSSDSSHQCEQNVMPVDELAFRDALGQFPTGVVIVSTVTDTGEWLGMTVSSFNSISLSPPLVLFSVARRALSFSAWRSADRFAISVLSEDQEELSNRFARSKGEKWEGLESTVTRTLLPLLPDSLVAFECETYCRYDGGDHEIIMGRVLEIHGGNTDRQPLVVAKGRYQRLTGGGDPTPWGDATLLYGW